MNLDDLDSDRSGLVCELQQARGIPRDLQLDEAAPAVAVVVVAFLAYSLPPYFTGGTLFTINGYLAARQRRFAQHRRHVVLGATLALSIVTNRIWTPVLVITFQPLQDSVFGGGEEHFVWFVAGVGARGWAGRFRS